MFRISRLRQSILKWAFEGRLVDQDPTDEPAAALLERIQAEREATAPEKRTKAPRRRRKEKTA
jgi:type I restriction enzyme S subunit